MLAGSSLDGHRLALPVLAGSVPACLCLLALAGCSLCLCWLVCLLGSACVLAVLAVPKPVPVLVTGWLGSACLPAGSSGWLANKNILTCYWHVSDMLQSRIAGFTSALRSLARVCVRAKPFGRVNPFGKVVFGKVVTFGIWYLVFDGW